MPSSRSQGKRARLSSRKFAEVPATSGMRSSIGPRISPRVCYQRGRGGPLETREDKPAADPMPPGRRHLGEPTNLVVRGVFLPGRERDVQEAVEGLRFNKRAVESIRPVGLPEVEVHPDMGEVQTPEQVELRRARAVDRQGAGRDRCRGVARSRRPSSGRRTSASDRRDWSTGPVIDRVTAWWTLVPARISTGYGNRRGVQKVLNEPSVQFRWSSVSNTSPSNRRSAQTPGETSCDNPISSRNGFLGATNRGNSASLLRAVGVGQAAASPRALADGMEDTEADPVPEESRTRLAIDRESQRTVLTAFDDGSPEEIAPGLPHARPDSG